MLPWLPFASPCPRAECAATSLKRLGEQTFPSTCQVLEPFCLAISRFASSRLIGYMARVRNAAVLGARKIPLSQLPMLRRALGEGSSTTRTGRPCACFFLCQVLGRRIFVSVSPRGRHACHGDIWTAIRALSANNRTPHRGGRWMHTVSNRVNYPRRQSPSPINLRPLSLSRARPVSADLYLTGCLDTCGLTVHTYIPTVLHTCPNQPYTCPSASRACQIPIPGLSPEAP